MSQFHSIKVKEVRSETLDSVSVHFDIPEDLISAYTYKPGQYLTLKVFINGDEYRRAYSLCTSPYTDNVPAIAVKRVDGGKVSNYINDVFAEGSQVEIMSPMGKFTTELNEFYSRHFVMYAGGSGITPMMSLIKSILEVESSSSVTLIYGNRNQESIIFYKELDELEGHFADRFKIIHSLNKVPSNWKGEEGLLNKDKVKSIIANLTNVEVNKAHHFICGPNIMMKEVQAALSDLNVPEDKINVEFFTSNLEDAQAADTSVGEVDDSPFTGVAKVMIDLHGDEHEIEVSEKQTILQASMEAGIDPPFACQMGICTTCRAKMSTGSVHMDETEGLTQDEVDEGYILTCQAHPKSNKISIKFE